MKALCYWLASKLAPQLAREAALWRHASLQYSQANRWLAEFPAICTVLEWVFIGTRDYFRPLHAPAQCTLPVLVGDLRRYLRQHFAPPAPGSVRCDAVPEHQWVEVGAPRSSEYEPTLVSGVRRCARCGTRQHYTAGAAEKPA